MADRSCSDWFGETSAQSNRTNPCSSCSSLTKTTTAAAAADGGDSASNFSVPWPSVVSYPFLLQGGCSSSFNSWSTEDRAASALKSHSQAEKRRRDRINAQLSTLRKLIPKSDKMDKAALLGNVVEHVKELKTRALEVSEVVAIPTDFDNVTIDQASISSTGTGGKTRENILIRASVCCDDRPDLFAELNAAIRGLKLTTQEAEITSMGGRTRTMFLLSCGDDGDQGGVCMDSLKQSLRLVLSRIATSPSTSGYRIRSKRQRFFLPCNLSNQSN